MPNTADAESKFDEVHSRIQAKPDEVHADLKQLAADLREANQESARARKDRIAGIKRALRDLLEAADQAERRVAVGCCAAGPSSYAQFTGLLLTLRQARRLTFQAPLARTSLLE